MLLLVVARGAGGAFRWWGSLEILRLRCHCKGLPKSFLGALSMALAITVCKVIT